MNKKRSKDHYIDNVRFFEAMQEWKKAIREAEDSGEDKPPITGYIGECFLKIAEHLATKPNFAHYSYKEEMICDAIENCVVYAANFDPEKSKNPFSYFTQIIYYAFLRRIQREKRQSFIKYKLVRDRLGDANIGKLTQRMKGFEDDTVVEYRDYAAKKFDLTDNDIEGFMSEITKEDKRKIKKPKKKKRQGLETLFEDKDEDRDNK